MLLKVSQILVFQNIVDFFFGIVFNIIWGFYVEIFVLI